GRGGDPSQRAAQLSQRLADDVPHRLVLRSAIERAVRLGGEAGILGGRGQRQVHGGGAAPQQGSQVQVGADRLAGGGRGLQTGQVQEGAGRSFGRRVLPVA